MSQRQPGDAAHGADRPEHTRSRSGTRWSEEDYTAAGKGRLVLRVQQTDLDKLDQIAKATKRSRSAVVAEWIRAWGT